MGEALGWQLKVTEGHTFHVKGLIISVTGRELKKGRERRKGEGGGREERKEGGREEGGKKEGEK